LDRQRETGTAIDRVLVGGGEMGALMRAFGWNANPLGAVAAWPQSLRSAVSILLPSKAQICMFWGPQLITLYNDAYCPVLGTKHPWALGRPAWECWREVWHVLQPLFEKVTHTGEAFWAQDYQFFLERYGFPEETNFDISYDPIRDESGGVGGIFCIVSETTGRVLGERRLGTLRELGVGGPLESAEAVCKRAAGVLGQNPADVPFALLYLFDEQHQAAHLAATTGLAPDAATREVDLSAATAAAQSLLTARAAEAPPDTFVTALPPTASAERVLVLPLRAAAQPAGCLVVGVSRHLALSGAYRDFFDLVADRIGTAIGAVRAYEQERRRAEALAELDRAKTAFFSNVSHEFRTPLTLLLGPLEDALAGGLPEPQREQVATAHRNSLRLLKLVNNLLDFSRIEAGRVEAVYEPTDLAAFTAELASVFRSATARAGLRLVVDCPPLPEAVYVDREMWEKIVLNLLSNALKFTFDGALTVRLRWAGDHVALSVTDTGTGIPPEELPNLFTRFHRIRGARARTHEGTGIGLALVHELARLHGGAVGAESELERGSTFTVKVPTGTAHLPPERLSAGRTLQSTALGAAPYVEEALRWLPDMNDAAAGQHGAGVGRMEDEDVNAAGSASSLQPPQGSFILVVDDNADLRDYLRRQLGQHWAVEVVADGASALARAREHVPDLVLSDVMMPGLDGFELLRALRADEHTHDVPVILLSARAGEEAEVEGLRAGADDYLVKPFSANELLARVGAHLRLRRLRREALAALRASEAKFATAFGQSPLALTITRLDDGRLVEVNEGFLRLSGYTRAEVLGRTPVELGLWVEPEQRSDGLQWLRAGQPLPTREVRFQAKNGEEIIGVIGAAVVEIDGRPCVLSSVTDITARKQMEQERAEYARRLEVRVAERTAELAAMNATLEHSEAELRRLSAYLQKVREDERTRVAREIHDELGQQLTGLKMDVAALKRKLDPTVRPALSELNQAVDGTIQTVRRLASELRPSILDDFGLVAALEAHLNEFERRAGVKGQLEAAADDSTLSHEARTALFRIFQEALTNIARHAQASAVSVRLQNRDGRLELEVRDNGRGIHPDEIAGDGSLGLIGMRERVRLLDGELHITGTPGQGTSVLVRVPA
jgi:PAS domain S-box-containing protein